jgi:hypothetical protein
MAIYDFFLSRNNGPTLQTYVGHKGRLFYDDATGEIRLGDGVTPGGFPIPVAFATSTTAGSVKPNGSFSIAADGTLALLAATDTRIGGVRLGPGVETNAQGQIIIDSEGLDFSFGNFAAIVGEYAAGAPKEGESYALLQSIEENEDVVIASNGTGSVNLVGEFRVFATNNTIDEALTELAGFRITADGQVRVIVPDATTLTGGVQIVGNSLALQQDPVNTGVMLHITGQDGDEARSYVDAVGGYAGFVGRRMNGTAASPSGVLANQEVTRFAANVYASDEGFGDRGVGQLRWYAAEDITSTNKGGRAEFWITPVGAATTQKIVSFDGNGITMAEGKTITGTVSTATNLAAASNILTGTVTVEPPNINAQSTNTQTATVTGLTTGHKVIVTSATELEEGVVVAAAWASAANTLSIQFSNTRFNQAVNPGAKTITYFAWV